MYIYKYNQTSDKITGIFINTVKPVFINIPVILMRFDYL
jgi:hypothetical protein